MPTLEQIDGRSKKATIQFDADGVEMHCVLSRPLQGITWWHVTYGLDDSSDEDDLFGSDAEDGGSDSTSDPTDDY